MSIPRAARRGVALVAASLMLLAGCSQPDPGGEAAQSGAPGDDGRLQLAMLLAPRAAMSPFSDDAFKLMRWSVTETLVKLDANGDAQPWLATEWKRIDPLTWSFTIRDGVTFHDGTPMTAASVERALTSANNASPTPRVLDGVGLTAKADGNSVVVTTKEPDPLLPMRLSSPQLAILSEKAYADLTSVSPIGTATGAFVLTALNGTATATLDRFDAYWGDKAASSGLDVTFVPDGTARVAALRTGTADVVEAVPAGQMGGLDPALLHEVPTPRTTTLHLNTASGATKDPAVRAAIASAIDRTSLVEGIYEGHADISQGLFGPAIAWSTRRDSPLAATSAPVASPVAAGTKLTLATYSDRPELPELAGAIAAQLEKAGLTVEQTVREWGQIENDGLAGKFDMFILSRAVVLDTGDPVSYLSSDYTCKGTNNFSKLCDPAVDKAVNAAVSVEPGTARQDALLAAEKAIIATNAAIPLLHERVILGAGTDVRDLVLDPRERELVSATTRVE